MGTSSVNIVTFLSLTVCCSPWCAPSRSAHVDMKRLMAANDEYPRAFRGAAGDTEIIGGLVGAPVVIED